MSAIHFADSFTGTGALAGTDTEVGALEWAELVASLNRAGGVLSGAGTDVVDAAWPNATVTVTGGTAYGRVADASNWWRARISTRQVVTSTSTYFGAWSAWSDFVAGKPSVASAQQPTDPVTEYLTDYRTTTQDGNGPTIDYLVGYSGGWQYQERTRQVLSSSTFATYYSVVLEKSVAGAVTAVATSSEIATNPGTVALSAPDDTLTATAGSLTVSATDSAFNAATKWGVSGPATDWSLDLVGADQPPAIVSPAMNADVDIANALVTIKTGLPITDPQTAGDAQWRNAGASSWMSVVDAFGIGQTWQIPEADLTPGTQVEVQARVTDSNGNTTGWSTSQFFTPRTAPTAPAFVSPTVGSDVVAADIATVNFDNTVASTARQARRVADDGSGNPDTTTVYQAALTIALDSGDANYLLSGDGSIHPTGAEHIQARRQTADGGTLWSDWADLPVNMALPAPFTPVVAITKLPADAKIQFAFTCQAADVDHTDTDHIDCYRAGVRVASITVIDGAASWLDQVPASAWDYVFTAVAVNGATASWGVES